MAPGWQTLRVVALLEGGRAIRVRRALRRLPEFSSLLKNNDLVIDPGQATQFAEWRAILQGLTPE